MEDQFDLLFSGSYLRGCIYERCTFCGVRLYVDELTHREGIYACDDAVCNDSLFYYSSFGVETLKLRMEAFSGNADYTQVIEHIEDVLDSIIKVDFHGPAHARTDLVREHMSLVLDDILCIGATIDMMNEGDYSTSDFLQKQSSVCRTMYTGN